METWAAVLGAHEVRGQLTEAAFTTALRTDVGLGPDDLSDNELSSLWAVVSSMARPFAGQNSVLHGSSSGGVSASVSGVVEGLEQHVGPLRGLISSNDTPMGAAGAEGIPTRKEEHPARAGPELPAQRPEEGVPVQRGAAAQTPGSLDNQREIRSADNAGELRHEHLRLVEQNKALAEELQAARMRADTCHQVLAKREGELVLANGTVSALRMEYEQQKMAAEKDAQVMFSQAARKIAQLTRQCQHYRTEMDRAKTHAARLLQQQTQEAPQIDVKATDVANGELTPATTTEGPLGLVRSTSYPNPMLDHRHISPPSVRHLAQLDGAQKSGTVCANLERRLRRAQNLLSRTPTTLRLLRQRQALGAWRQGLLNVAITRRLEQTEQQLSTFESQNTEARQEAAVAKQQASAVEQLLCDTRAQSAEELEVARNAAIAAEQHASSAKEKAVAIETALHIERTQSAEQIEAARKAASTAEQQAIELRSRSVQRVVRHMRQASQAAAFGRWTEFAMEIQRNRAIVARLRATLVHRTLQGTFDRWYSNCQYNQRAKAIVLRVLARVQQALEASAFQSWADFAVEVKRNRAIVARLRARITASIVQHVFDCWLTNIKIIQRTNVVVLRALTRWRNEYLSATLIRWTKFCYVSATVRKLLTRMRLGRVGAALQRWREEVILVQFHTVAVTRFQVGTRLRARVACIRAWAAGTRCRRRLGRGLLQLQRKRYRLTLLSGIWAWRECAARHRSNRRKAQRVVQHLLDTKLCRALEVWGACVLNSKRQIHDEAILAVIGRVLARMAENSVASFWTRWVERVIVAKYQKHESTIKAALAAEAADLQSHVASKQAQIYEQQAMAERQRVQAIETEQTMQQEIFSAQATAKKAVVKMMQAHEDVTTTRDLAAQQLAAVESDLHSQLSSITVQLHKAEAAMRTKLTRTNSEHADRFSEQQGVVTDLISERDGLQIALERARGHTLHRCQIKFLEACWQQWRAVPRARLCAISQFTRKQLRRSLSRWCSHVNRSRQCELQWMRAQIFQHEQGFQMASKQLVEKEAEVQALKIRTSEMRKGQLQQIARIHAQRASPAMVSHQIVQGAWLRWLARHRAWLKRHLARTEAVCTELQAVVVEQQQRITELCGS